MEVVGVVNVSRALAGVCGLVLEALCVWTCLGLKATPGLLFDSPAPHLPDEDMQAQGTVTAKKSGAEKG